MFGSVMYLCPLDEIAKNYFCFIRLWQNLLAMYKIVCPW